MTLLGRILQTVGWVWLALGFFGPIFSLPIRLNIFPAIIILFVARILRSQGARNAPEEPEQVQPVEQEPQPRALNTDRVRTEVASPQKTPPAAPAAQPPRAQTPEAKRQEMLEQILVAGTDLAAETAVPEPGAGAETELPGSTQPMSSAEMIAQAHKRWNKRP